MTPNNLMQPYSLAFLAQGIDLIDKNLMDENARSMFAIGCDNGALLIYQIMKEEKLDDSSKS